MFFIINIERRLCLFLGAACFGNPFASNSSICSSSWRVSLSIVSLLRRSLFYFHMVLANAVFWAGLVFPGLDFDVLLAF